MNKQWYGFLAEQQTRDFLVKNCQLILEKAEDEELPGDNETADVLIHDQRVNLNQFIFFLKRIKADKIFKDYEIDDFLGSGAVGMAFSLKEPHEDYVLKIQIIRQSSTLKGYGTDYPEEIFNRQQQGEYRRGELNVLESKKGVGMIDSSDGIIDVNYAIFVYSKVEQSIYSGKTGKMIKPDQAFSDVFGLQMLFKILMDDRIDDITKEAGISNALYYWRFKLPLKNTDITNRAAKTINYKFKTRGIKSVAAYVYNFYKTDFLSKEQFVKLSEEFFKQTQRSEKEGKPIDFHGGNFGFRQKSDVPISFDV